MKNKTADILSCIFVNISCSGTTEPTFVATIMFASKLVLWAFAKCTTFSVETGPFTVLLAIFLLTQICLGKVCMQMGMPSRTNINKMFKTSLA